MQRGEGRNSGPSCGPEYFERTLYGEGDRGEDFKNPWPTGAKSCRRPGIVKELDIHISRKDVPQYLLAGHLVEAE